ncbi:hypothetical protein I6N90_17735 [Paenibacillus sp. GSMTC-2017]|uniref:hypothetical protein n=1 Tax=Paenibacillus sp. GSMTC-2017 TaxID=2794350 RepID=UPI0018D5BDE0|nr:hypothetical protein [Paenibacillus sp. GSMTC-2017]MBH5319641.1 hypothetical protein [Paenibacillus sp. GSMTC-2017]
MKYESELETISKYINEWDPIGLLAGGAPPNEYSIEIRELAAMNISLLDEVELAKLIQDVFLDFMGIKLRTLNCLDCAMKIKGSLK